MLWTLEYSLTLVRDTLDRTVAGTHCGCHAITTMQLFKRSKWRELEMATRRKARKRNVDVKRTTRTSCSREVRKDDARSPARCCEPCQG